MKRLQERGYGVRANNPVVHAKDVEGTIRWFEEILGWYGQVDERSDTGGALYGFVFDLPIELIHTGAQIPFTGIHVFAGAPVKEVIAFMEVVGIAKLYERIEARCYDEKTELVREPWGAQVFELTMPEGSRLRFYEPSC